MILLDEKYLKLWKEYVKEVDEKNKVAIQKCYEANEAYQKSDDESYKDAMAVWELKEAQYKSELDAYLKKGLVRRFFSTPPTRPWNPMPRKCMSSWGLPFTQNATEEGFMLWLAKKEIGVSEDLGDTK